MKMETIKKFLSDKKEQNRRQYEESLKKDFDVAERNGSLYLTHCGVAFMKIESMSDADSVAKSLNVARSTAVEFSAL